MKWDFYKPSQLFQESCCSRHEQICKTDDASTLITSGYCNIPLKFMVEHSRKHSILINAKLDRRIDLVLKTVPEFKATEDALRKYMANKGLTGSKPDDWNDITKAKASYADIKELRHRHLHMSSAFTVPVMDPGFTPRIEGNRRRRFYYEG